MSSHELACHCTSWHNFKHPARPSIGLTCSCTPSQVLARLCTLTASHALKRLAHPLPCLHNSHALAFPHKYPHNLAHPCTLSQALPYPYMASYTLLRPHMPPHSSTSSAHHHMASHALTRPCMPLHILAWTCLPLTPYACSRCPSHSLTHPCTSLHDVALPCTSSQGLT